MSTSIVLNSESFSDATDAFRCRCTVAFLICLSEENIATQPAPPNLAFKVPETSVLAAVSRPVLEGFRRYLAEPNNAPLFWLSREAGGKEPVPWSIPVGLLAEEVQHEHDLDDDEAEIESANKFKKTRVLFPIKLYANFRVTKRGEIFPFYAANMHGPQLVDALSKNALHALKRSVAIMNPNSYRDFLGELNPQDMQQLYDFCMMDSVSIAKRSQLSRFHKDILGTINVQSWPVMVHSMESGRTLTLAIPATVLMVDSSAKADEQTMEQRNKAAGYDSDASSSSPAGSPVIVMGIQGQFIAHRQMKKKQSSSNDNNSNNDGDDDEDDNKKNKRPTIFGDVVKTLQHKINPKHLDSLSAAMASAEDDVALDLLRRRLVVGGLPDSPLAETPLRWLMEHLVGSDLALHVLLLPPNHHTK